MQSEACLENQLSPFALELRQIHIICARAKASVSRRESDCALLSSNRAFELQVQRTLLAETGSRRRDADSDNTAAPRPALRLPMMTVLRMPVHHAANNADAPQKRKVKDSTDLGLPRFPVQSGAHSHVLLLCMPLSKATNAIALEAVLLF